MLARPRRAAVVVAAADASFVRVEWHDPLRSTQHRCSTTVLACGPWFGWLVGCDDSNYPDPTLLAGGRFSGSGNGTGEGIYFTAEWSRAKDTDAETSFGRLLGENHSRPLKRHLVHRQRDTRACECGWISFIYSRRLVSAFFLEGQPNPSLVPAQRIVNVAVLFDLFLSFFHLYRS